MSYSASRNAPRTVVDNRNVAEMVSRELYRAIDDYHYHVGHVKCSGCRDPWKVYNNEASFCRVGDPIVATIKQNMYLRAQHSSKGIYRVKVPGIEVEMLISMLCYESQGENTLDVKDLKRHRPAASAPRLIAAPLAEPSRGSCYDDDMQSSEPRKARRLAHHDPHQSLLDIPQGHSQRGGIGSSGYPSPGSTHSNISSDGQKSVHFADRIRVREYLP